MSVRAFRRWMTRLARMRSGRMPSMSMTCGMEGADYRAASSATMAPTVGGRSFEQPAAQRARRGSHDRAAQSHHVLARRLAERIALPVDVGRVARGVLRVRPVT